MSKQKYFVQRCENILSKGMPVSVLFAGVGGQGILLSSTVLASVCLKSGYDVKVSEVHGMAQRGGSVLGSVRFADKVYSPTIEKTDYLVSLEMLEALRYSEMLYDEGAMIVSGQKICPVSSYSLNIPYPEDITEKICNSAKNPYIIDALSIAQELKNQKVANLILLGCLSMLMPLKLKYWHESIKENVPAKATALNLEAFARGRNILIKGG